MHRLRLPSCVWPSVGSVDCVDLVIQQRVGKEHQTLSLYSRVWSIKRRLTTSLKINRFVYGRVMHHW